MNTLVDGSTAVDAGLRWNNRFASLGPSFHTRLAPHPLPDPYWVGKSRAVAGQLGLSDAWMDSPVALEVFAGNLPLSGSAPLASVYSGHQFGQWAGQLGDGRAILLGEVATGDAEGLEVQLKGSGLTPYSRMGDGRAVLRSSVREFLCSEAMHGLGIPTSRALCIVGSDAPVHREETETAAVVTRVAPSFIRFGHFEHFSARGQLGELKTLADFVIDRFYPACRETAAFDGNPYAALLEAVSGRTAAMVAQWQAVGFCHGVMNTDNMSILGLTLDYGPFQFLDAYDPGHICNHSDPQGRYAYDRQPNIAYWNLFCLGQALLPLIGEPDQAMAALEPFKTVFPRELVARMRAKLGLTDAPREQDRDLIDALLMLMAQDRVDYSIFWRRLSRWMAGEGGEPVQELFIDRASLDAWMLRYQERIETIPRWDGAHQMLKTNPRYILRNHLGEEAIRAAKVRDYSWIERLLTLLERPFEEHPGSEALAGFPPDWASTLSISCSS
jgi:uncharacterized protein YdiU (UPF0061 family)